jgi:hypothetical protein
VVTFHPPWRYCTILGAVLDMQVTTRISGQWEIIYLGFLLMAQSNAERQRLHRARRDAANSGRLDATVTRAASALLVAKATGDFAEEVAQQHFSKDALLPAEIRSATSPTTAATSWVWRRSDA